jgi:hypothetical protein
MGNYHVRFYRGGGGGISNQYRSWLFVYPDPEVYILISPAS